jgi:hypothetical protein
MPHGAMVLYLPWQMRQKCLLFYTRGSTEGFTPGYKIFTRSGFDCICIYL